MRDRVESLCAAQLVLAVRGVARHDTLRGGIPAEVGHCWSVIGRAGLGLAKLHTLHPSGCSSVAIRGLVRRIRAGRCSARQTHCPLSGDRSLRQGLAWPGAAWRGKANTQHPCGGAEVWRGIARHGTAGHGEARHRAANTQHPCEGAEVC
jgi:hypothetical protein